MKLIIDIDPRYCKDMHSEVKALYYEAITRITEAVSNGSPYEERPQGKWKNISMGITYKYQCSLCGRTISTTPMSLADYPFCHCGADMRKGSAE